MTKLLIANWKSHKSRAAIEEWMAAFEVSSPSFRPFVEVAIAPPMPGLMFVSNRLLDRTKHRVTSLAVQDLSSFPAGAYTGAASTENLDGFNVKYAILGHSERRRYFHETHQDVANKVEQALAAGIIPVVCVDAEYIRAQAAALPEASLSQVIVAYEPLEAIGSGLEEPTDKVQKVVEEIGSVFGQVKVLYGGSVSAANVGSYLSVTDGAIIGTHSLKVDDFVKVVIAAQAQDAK